MNVEPDLAQVVGADGPERRTRGHRLDVLLIAEARQLSGRSGAQLRADQAAA